MTNQQMILVALFAAILAALLWGRFRHDLVAAAGLFAAVILGLVPEDKAFSGFSHPAVVIVALVLIASRAIENSGAVAYAATRLGNDGRPLWLHIAIIGTIGAALSAIVNNVAALTLLMTVEIQAARKADRSPALTLMPLAFATILGGMVTLVGTPPNIIAAGYREQALGAPYRMFDFAPVGGPVAVAGLAFVALIGWRLLRVSAGASPTTIAEGEFQAELAVPEGSPVIGKLVDELDEEAEKADVVIFGILRKDASTFVSPRFARIEVGDILAVEGATDAVASFIKALALQGADPQSEPEVAGKDRDDDRNRRKPLAGPTIIETVVRSDARIAWKTAESFRLRSRFGITLLGISRRGRAARDHVQTRTIEPGDVLLVTGPKGALGHAFDWFGLVPLNEVSIAPATLWKTAVALGFFAAAVTVATLGLLSFSVAMAIAVAGYGATGLISPREFYENVEWPIIVMLACLLPLGAAFESVGATALVADQILRLTSGQSAVVTLIALMIVTMTLSDVLNNVATMVIAAPVAIAVATRLGANPDTFLMGVTVATSCAFLTPIGHKNNTLVMGPGGYRFSDYWRIGLPLELVVLLVAVPMLLLAWPL